MIVYKDQGTNWHPQSDSLGVSSLKQTHSTPPLISSLCCLVESLGQIDFALLVVSATPTQKRKISESLTPEAAAHHTAQPSSAAWELMTSMRPLSDNDNVMRTVSEDWQWQWQWCPHQMMTTSWWCEDMKDGWLDDNSLMDTFPPRPFAPNMDTDALTLMRWPMTTQGHGGWTMTTMPSPTSLTFHTEWWMMMTNVGHDQWLTRPPLDDDNNNMTMTPQHVGQTMLPTSLTFPPHATTMADNWQGPWNTSRAASTLGYLNRQLGPLGKWRNGLSLL